MNYKYYLTFLFACLLFIQWANGQQFTVKRYAITNVTVIPMDKEASLPNQTVLIENGIIKEMGNAASVKAGKDITVIDGKGKFLLPGLFDMHTHFFYEQGEHKNTCEAELKMMLANGLTSARILAGHPAYLEARTKVKEGKWIGPDLVIASPQLVGSWPWSPDFKNFEIVDTKEKAANAVRRFKQDGYDAIKITFMVKREVYDEIINTAKQE